MARGKPSRAQLDMVSGILTVLQSPEDCFDGALDVRNYGELTGIPSAKRLFAELLGVMPSQILVGGSASLNLMYDLIAKAWTYISKINASDKTLVFKSEEVMVIQHTD